jgi:type IX secretion system substrate protein/carboxypeptidase-like protein/cleaved adhesin domain-containing protein
MKRIIISFAFVFSLISSNAQVPIVDQGFESWPLQGWSIFTLGAGNGWIDDWQGIYNTGSNSAYSSISNSQCNNWMVTPQINISSNDYELKFWELNDDVQYYVNAAVMISTGSGNPTSGDFVELFSGSDHPEIWTQRTIDLSAYVGQNIYIAFLYQGTWHTWFIDDVLVSPANFTDGNLSQLVSPVGVSESTSTENIIVRLENNGTTIINNVDISWEVNNVSQAPYSNASLNLLPGETIDLTIGTFSFNSPGAYNITADLTLAADIYSTNNAVLGNYSVSTIKDGALVGVTPEAMSPLAGLQDVSVLVENQDINPIDAIEVEWSVNGIPQTSFAITGINIDSGDTEEFIIGQYNFQTGVHEISATLNTLGDVNEDNDTYLSYAAIDTVWESFEGRIFPPENWTSVFSVKDNINFDTPPHGENYFSAFTDDNYFGYVSDTMFTPLLDIQAGDQFRMRVKANDFIPANKSVVWKDGVTGEIHVIQSYTTTAETWEEVVIDISAAAGVNKIGIVTATTGSYGDVKYDLISSDAKLHTAAKDLAVKNGEIYFLAKENLNEGFDCLVKNAGSSQVLGNEYTVRLMEEPGIELASAPGITLNPWGETIITVNHTFTSISAHRLYFEIDFAGDDIIVNNTFRSSDVHVVPNTVILNDIGQPDYQSLNFPFNSGGSTNSLGQDDISQTLYESSEISTSGDIYGFIYKYDNILAGDEVKLLPLKVWITQTDSTNLAGGWYPYDELTLVFDDTIEILQGFGREVYIPFNTPITYTGLNNILIQDYQYDPAWPPAGLRFYGASMPSGPIRTIAAIEVYNLDPTAPEPFYNEFQDITYTRFVIDPIVDYCDAAGTVYGTGNIPLSGATVNVEGAGISVQTDINGEYMLPALPFGTYNLTAGILGYNDSTIIVELNTGIFTQDFYLDERAQVDLTGMVAGSNAPATALENVQVTAVGYTNDNAVTDIDGNFTLENIFGISEYQLTFSLYGYYDTTIIVNVTDANINLGAVIMQQEFISPFDVNVSYDSDVLVQWKDPLKSDKVKLQNDFDVNSFSFTNEPNENVWLGNVFSISDTTTLTSVEFVADVYLNAIDFITIDVFDASEQLIASSKPFLIYPDSVHIVDIPNIVVYDSIFVMVHWQNNAESTNALVLDFSDPAIPNTAVIRYPDEPIQVLSDFLGGAPNMSFLLRTNTLDVGNNTTNNEDLTYNVYRGLASEFPNISNWEKINATPVTEESTIDTELLTSGLAGLYRYAVETIYEEGTSKVTFSNTLDFFVSTENVLNTHEINIYPNPTSGDIWIDFEFEDIEDVRIEVINALGQKIIALDKKAVLNVREQVNLSGQAPGVYFISIIVNDESYSEKIILN